MPPTSHELKLRELRRRGAQTRRAPLHSVEPGEALRELGRVLDAERDPRVRAGHARLNHHLLFEHGEAYSIYDIRHIAREVPGDVVRQLVDVYIE